MFQASFEPNANLHTGMGQETARADSLPDTTPHHVSSVQLWKKKKVLELPSICQTNSIIVL